MYYLLPLQRILWLLIVLLCPQLSLAMQKVLHSKLIDFAPKIDGIAKDKVWQNSPVLVVQDAISNIDIQIQSVYSKSNIYFLVKFADENENKAHKVMFWDIHKQRYITGPKREDSFVFKWSMLPLDMDISLSANTPYKADIWYWKSFRTNHAGFADDKIHIYQQTRKKHSKLLLSKEGQFFYLLRNGDAGHAAYSPKIFNRKKKTQKTAKYSLRMPSGSRADVKAKGIWEKGQWTIEFARLLTTGHFDDVQFRPLFNYYFGVSRYEIAGDKVNKTIEQPQYGAGDIRQTIKLEFSK